MKQVLSPRQMATVLGVSESSIKRWVDDGAITSTKTAGGHRRISVSEAISFIRRQGLSIAEGELIGLPRVNADHGSTNAAIKESLLQGDQPALERLLVDHYAAGGSVASICDGGIRDAFVHIGELWQHQEEGIFIEHRAVDTCLGALSSLGSLLPKPDDNAPHALGGAPSDDPYIIPSLMASICLSEQGFKTTNLGPNTPWETFIAAAKQTNPKLIWIAASAPINVAHINAAESHFKQLEASGISIFLGGRCSSSFAHLKYCDFSDSLINLVELANGVRSQR